LIKSYQNGHFLAAISDGMGKGYKAFEDSKRVLDALDSLCYCATSVNTNIEILNLLYILQGYTERYSTIDAIDINRSTMNASIYKLGASSSYIFHEDNTYTKIENNSLPLGIEEDVLRKEIELKYNDLILLSSDGIFENIVNENGLLELIKTIKDELPQKIAYEVLQYTINSKVKVKDDMSIVILKVEQIT
jgi:stage II sporulation protein E